MLLQIWAWECLHIGRYERFVAQEQDLVVPDGEAVKNKVQVSEVDMVNQETLPTYPLGCRVLCQFGLNQGIPVQCDTEVNIQAIDRWGRHHYNWKAYHQLFIKLWASREKSIVTAQPKERTVDYHDLYIKWYQSITHRLITPLTQRPHKQVQPANGMSHLLVHFLTNIHNQCTATLGTFTSESAMQSLTDIQIMCTCVLQMIREIRNLDTILAPTTTMTPPSSSQANDMEGLPLLIAQMPTKTKSLLVRGRGKALGTQQKVMEPVITLQHASLQVAIASLVAPSQSNDIHIEEPSTLNLEGYAAPVESMHLLEGETTTEKVPLYP
ncbi:hypothetical protein Patl1_14747 [Pistacia atlantica]|uniref:Uncharacterized protein n=1 Tax=Pistacia atlantica TaxID=434234 RepID=A0ACC1AWT0_9ROSI|nr:hypothetical protein Patl1_14747 [Pistacia atlantica]